MSISSIQTGQSIYPTFQKNTRTSNTGNVDVSSRAYKETDHSTIRALRDGFVSQINKVAGNDEDAERLLRDYSRPDNGGLLFAGLLDLSNPDAMRRFDRISQLFAAENKNVESQRAELIAQGRAVGKKPQEVLNDIIDLYDSQSDLYKFGRGWNGDVFAFDEFSPAGYQHTLRYTSDVVDTHA